MKQSIATKPVTEVASPLSDHYSRALAYLFVAVTALIGCYLKHFSNGVILLVPYALLYPQLVKLLAGKCRQRLTARCQHYLVVLDAVNMGAFSALFNFTLVPGSIALLITSFAALILGGLRSFAFAMVFFIVSAAATWFLYQPAIDLSAPYQVTLGAMAAAFIYFCFTAYYVHFQGIFLSRAKEDIRREQAKAAHLARSLAKYLSPQVWQTIFSGKRSVKLETQRKKLTVFFSDIKGFTELSEELEAEALTDVLNTYLNEMSKIALKYGGTIDKFIGDSVMIFFGDPATQGAKKDAQAAVSMAIEMRKHMKALRQHWRSQGIDKPLEIRMGINTGYCTVGNFGAETRMDYTIVGREVNLASRLENAADANEILVSNETYSLVKDIIMGRDKGQIQVKGFTRPVQIYQVVNYRRDLGASSSYVEHELQGFSMYLDTNNIQGYDKERIIEALHEAAEHLKDKII